MPVIVVRPSSKRDKARNKRALDPNRHAYKDLLEKSGNLIDTDARNVYTEDSRPQSRQASEDEAAAVAAAIGYRPIGGSPLVQSQTIPAALDAAIEEQDLKNIGVVMKSPELQNLDSPDISDSSSSDEEDEGGVLTDDPAVGLDSDQNERAGEREKSEEISSGSLSNTGSDVITDDSGLCQPPTVPEAQSKDEAGPKREEVISATQD